MGEILGGIIVMGAFILFVLWKNKDKSQSIDSHRKHEEQQYWAARDQEDVKYGSNDSDSD